jgi:O-antigen ligase
MTFMTAASIQLTRVSPAGHASFEVGDQTLRRFALAAMVLLPVMTFTIPGQPSPSGLKFLDSLALVKTAILAFVCIGGSVVMLLQAKRPLFQKIIVPLFPLIIFLVWSIFSVVWSPLKAVTMGQAGGLAALIIYAIAIALICYESERVPRVLTQLAIVLLGFSAFIVAVHFLYPHSSGLDRKLIDSGGDGVVHPTASGAAAALGLLLITLGTVIGRIRWPMWLLIASVIAHSAVLFYSNSRGSTLLLVMTAGSVLFLFSNNRVRAVAMISLAVLLLAVVTLDPGLKSVSESVGASADYFARGQSVEDIRKVSGRAEMWSVIWGEFLKSPIIGHGYHITSETGAIEVWNLVANHTAHNIYLQVLAGTGIVGMMFFLVAMTSLLLHLQYLRGGGLWAARVGWILFFAALWFLGWSLTCVSFLGPVRAESVVFFTLVGVGVGQAARCLSDSAESTLSK